MHGTIARWKALDERAVEPTGANRVQNVLVLVVVLVRVHELKAVCHHVRTVGVHLRADCGHLQQPQRPRANAGAVRAAPKHVVAVRREAVRVAQDGKDLAGEPRLRVRHRLAQRVQEFRRVPLISRRASTTSIAVVASTTATTSSSARMVAWAWCGMLAAALI